MHCFIQPVGTKICAQNLSLLFLFACFVGNMDNQVGFDGFQVQLFVPSFIRQVSLIFVDMYSCPRSPQVSNQCMALVRDDCLVPTIDEPGLGYIRESSSGQYVPDVFYKVGAFGVFT